jgi:hypothetical protein
MDSHTLTLHSSYAILIDSLSRSTIWTCEMSSILQVISSGGSGGNGGSGSTGGSSTSTHTLLIFYSYSTHILLILYSYSTHTLLILYSYSTHTLLILYSFSTPALLLLYSYSTHTLLILYSHSTHTIIYPLDLTASVLRLAGGGLTAICLSSCSLCGLDRRSNGFFTEEYWRRFCALLWSQVGILR